MNIPDKIKIGYRNYAIEKNDRVWNKQTDSYGQFLSKEGIICLSSEEDSISQANTLIHEILHGIVYQWGLESQLDDKEEQIVNTMANGITTVIRDNPWLLSFIKNKVEEEKKNDEKK